jgi:hypothetical protein
VSAGFGTLRKDSYFTPGEVLDEATQLNNAIRALARIQFNNLESQGQDQLAAWNAFIASWDNFWGECNGSGSLIDPYGWFFRAKDSTRDNLLAFEDQYAGFKAQIGVFSGAASLPDPAPEEQRTADNVAAAIDSAGNAVSEGEKQAGQVVRNLFAELWPVLVVAGVLGAAYLFRAPLGRAVGRIAK